MNAPRLACPAGLVASASVGARRVRSRRAVTLGAGCPSTAGSSRSTRHAVPLAVSAATPLDIPTDIPLDALHDVPPEAAGVVGANPTCAGVAARRS
ncbi:hypothetical protein BTRA_128 [Burkholderia thailandensis USAMRU Malaysia |uniref:hypothetical protein n=1 Tax=Burkholderia thailandensis TaxID=57975 RepID=UPI00049A745F|nr:hypothetical protein [Burkholderia thailandensis]AIC87782.1 hypothetical protein BTRA_128 [Burkholderia thailandensis USAMRU Malaysia \